MYIGWREIRRSAGKFGLMTGVIALLSFMVVALSALTGGLQQQSVSAVQALPGSGLAVQQDATGAAATLVDSRLDAAAVERIRDADHGAAPLGIAMSGVGAGGMSTAVAVFGRADAAAGVRLRPDTAQTLGVSPGDEVTVGGTTARVSSIGETGMFAHSPVAEVPLDLWRQAAHRDELTAMITTGAFGNIHGVAQAQGSARLDLIPGYSSEHNSLLLIQGLLLVISAVVVGAFFAVWTSHRLSSLAVVRAMGAGKGYLLRDGLGQAAVVLGVGLTAGAVVGVAGAWAVSGVMPIAITASGVLVPIAAMAVLGLAGATLALRPLTSVDPLTALNR
ncbi:MAG: FtsX-like permease family protein [Gordonia sp. (in: high G+C Gram-positive bacteria)]|uniref:FtsX-like permease family protein n=1 Tax=Gordonia sp. (in: high G+C Gram-positive bacteria) TaxID=84139 RepID=UPI003BB50ABD